MKTLEMILLSLFVTATTIIGCSRKAPDSTAQFITRDGSKFIKNEKPYNYIGTNMWYASILGSAGQGGDRERLCKELDQLKSIGITNLRILSGPDAGSALANPKFSNWCIN